MNRIDMSYRNCTLLLIGLALLTLAVPLSAEPAATDSNPSSAVCHVCRVHEGETEPEEVVATAEHDGQTYGFCSVACRDKFVAEPIAYLPPLLPRPAPAFEAVGLDGASFSSEALEGQWTLLDFWATWCQPCVNDLPKLTELHRRYAEQGFAVVGISIDEGQGAGKKVARMMKRRKAAHPVYLDSQSNPAWSAYGVRVVPTQYLINPQGQIVAQWSGTIDLAKVEAELLRFLDGG